MNAVRYLFFVDQGDASHLRPRQIVRCDPDGSNPKQLTSITTHNPRGCWYNPADKHVYWVDLLDGELWKVNSDFSGRGVKVSDIDGNPNDITGDHVNGVLYYTDLTGGKIYKVNTDGSNNFAIANGLAAPFGLAFRPSNRFLYFSEIGTQKIRRLKVDFGFIADIITEGLIIPSAVDIDLVNDKLIYADQVDDKIKRSNFDGNKEEVLVDDPTKNQITFVLVDPFGESMYYQDSEPQRGIFKSRIDGKHEQLILTDGAFGIGLVQGICADTGINVVMQPPLAQKEIS